MNAKCFLGEKQLILLLTYSDWCPKWLLRSTYSITRLHFLGYSVKINPKTTEIIVALELVPPNSKDWNGIVDVIVVWIIHQIKRISEFPTSLSLHMSFTVLSESQFLYSQSSYIQKITYQQVVISLSGWDVDKFICSAWVTLAVEKF